MASSSHDRRVLGTIPSARGHISCICGGKNMISLHGDNKYISRVIKVRDINKDGIPDIMWIAEDISDGHWFQSHYRLYVNINGRWTQRYHVGYSEF